jgi:Flp pilus assembly protein TadD
MSISGRERARFGLALLGAGIILTGGAADPAAAQNAVPAQSSAGDALSGNLRTLADNPRSLSALMGAGRASLEVGDAQAALNFFTRAEEIAPRDGRIKMWVGAALVQIEQPRAALEFFDKAAALGVPQVDMAGDRGLAHDMLGDQRSAQREYELALRHRANPEITRRLALSFAISGERERALQLLEEQLLVRDRAAARTRAFVLALTGDAAGADRAAEASMPGPQAAAMAPFLARLPSLSPSDRALAVHFGHFPGSGQPAPTASAGLYASNDQVGTAVTAGTPDRGQPALGGRLDPVPEPVSTAARRRPDSGTLATANSAPAAQTTRVQATIKPKPRQTIPPAPVREAAAVPQSRLADVAATVASLSDSAAPPASSTSRTKPAATRPPAAAAASGTRQDRTRTAAAAPSSTKKATPPPPREPSRVWVQVAGGADKAALPREYARLKAKAPRLLGSRAPWTTPANATNRLLVGPFPSSGEAQAFVNELAKSGVAGFAWTSTAGQKVERLAAK